MYDFKLPEELLWVLAVAGATVVLEILVDFDPATITEWGTWVIAAGTSVVRAVAAAGLVWLGRRAVN